MRDGQQGIVHGACVVCWMWLRDEWGVDQALVGWIVGAMVLLFLQPLMQRPVYFARVIPLLRLMGLFAQELIRANSVVMRILMRRRIDICPAWVRIPTQLRSPMELTLLATLITLTPGTMTIDVEHEDEQAVLVVHALHVPDEQALIEEIQRTFERTIMEVTRR